MHQPSNHEVVQKAESASATSHLRRGWDERKQEVDLRKGRKGWGLPPGRESLLGLVSDITKKKILTPTSRTHMLRVHHVNKNNLGNHFKISLGAI